MSTLHRKSKIKQSPYQSTLHRPNYSSGWDIQARTVHHRGRSPRDSSHRVPSEKDCEKEKVKEILEWEVEEESFTSVYAELKLILLHQATMQ